MWDEDIPIFCRQLLDERDAQINELTSKLKLAVEILEAVSPAWLPKEIRAKRRDVLRKLTGNS